MNGYFVYLYIYLCAQCTLHSMYISVSIYATQPEITPVSRIGYTICHLPAIAAAKRTVVIERTKIV